MKCLDVSVFATDAYAGTRAEVRLGKTAPDGPVSPRETTEAVCYAWRENDCLQVRCYNGGVAIEFCGHGLLASAHAARLEGYLPERLCSQFATYGVREEAGSLWLRCPVLSCTSSSRTPTGWFDHDPLLAAVAGGDSGYWVLRWPDGFELARLRPDLQTIARSTGRAVIATAADGGDVDARLRYFAPQYGNDEDTVTGSACVVLADFWRHRLGDTLTFVQQSPRGGCVRTRHLGDAVEIGGRIEKVVCVDDAEQPAHKENRSDHALRK